MKRGHGLLFAIGLGVIFLGSEVHRLQCETTGSTPVQPFSGLTKDQIAEFNSGLQQFLHIVGVADGLGPAYNGTSCGACHNQPSVGGVGNFTALRAGILSDGRYQLPQGGDLVHLFSIADHRCQPRIPTRANNLARRIPTPLYGAGLVEAIPDSVIRAWEDPDDSNRDGIRGRAAIVMDATTHSSRVGRFGWKAQQATLLAFAGEAFRDEMGITNDLFPNEIGMGLSPEELLICDHVADPEDQPDPVSHLRGIDRLAHFMRFLAPATPVPQNETSRRGLELFTRIGCAACHVPELLTGTSDVPALDHQAVHAYSDFLLHDIATGDGVAQGTANGREFRTSPLWGLHFRKQLMHDGSALSPVEAIKQHGNEAQRSREAFEHLDLPEKHAVLEFLSTL